MSLHQPVLGADNLDLFLNLQDGIARLVFVDHMVVSLAGSLADQGLIVELKISGVMLHLTIHARAVMKV